VNVVGVHWGGKILKFTVVFKSTDKKKKKIKKKRKFSTKSIFEKIDFRYCYNYKANDLKNMTFSLNVNTSILYT